MQSFNLKGLFVDEDFLLNYKKYNMTAEEMVFFMQLNYLSEQGKKEFNVKELAEALQISEELFLNKITALYNKQLIKLSASNKLLFAISAEKENYYTLKELLEFVESMLGRILSSKDIDIVSSWIAKKYTKREIDDAFNISKNINYVNGILNNKPLETNNELDEDDILNYDWVDK